MSIPVDQRWLHRVQADKPAVHLDGDLSQLLPAQWRLVLRHQPLVQSAVHKLEDKALAVINTVGIQLDQVGVLHLRSIFE